MNSVARFRVRRAVAFVFIFATLVFAVAPAAYADYDNRPYIGDRYGVSRQDIVNWLSSHEHDNYYLGTTYGWRAYTAPNGDPYCTLSPGYSTGGVAMMNCAGFVAHVVYKAGLNVDAWNTYLAGNHPRLYYRQNYNIASADMWYLHVTGDETGFQGSRELTGAFRYYSFPSITAALNSGKMRKGDLFIFWPKEGYASDRTYTDSHIGVYWGDYAGQNKFWHMHWPYCEINEIWSFLGPYDFIVIPFSAGGGDMPSDPNNKGTLTVIERNEDKVALPGAQFTAKNDKTGQVYYLGPTDSKGTASVALPEGQYTLTQTAYPPGYTVRTKSTWSVSISKGMVTTLETYCALPRGTLEITQTDASGKGLSGAKFTAVRKSDKKTFEIGATGSGGKASASLPEGTYTVTQTAFPSHYEAKDGTASWTVTVSSGKTTSLATQAVLKKGAVGISVIDEDGEGVAGVYFSVRDTDDLSAEPIAEIMTDIDGSVVYGAKNGEYQIDHGTVLYFRYERTGRGSYIPDTKTYRVSVRGGETTWVGGGSVTLYGRSEITLSDGLPEGRYAVYTDSDCTTRAKVPAEDLSKDVNAYISTGESLTLRAGTYFLRLDEDTSLVHDGTTVTYTVTSRAYASVAVTADGAVSEDFVHHRFDGDAETDVNERGWTTHLCAGCGEQILFGDVNRDGALNSKDLIIMMRSLAGLKPNMDASVRDVNGDGKFNSKDVITLMKLFVAG